MEHATVEWEILTEPLKDPKNGREALLDFHQATLCLSVECWC